MSCLQILRTNILFRPGKTSDFIDECQRFGRNWLIQYQVLSWWYTFTKLHGSKFFISVTLEGHEVLHSNPFEGTLINVRSIRFFSSTLNMYVPDSSAACVKVYQFTRRYILVLRMVRTWYLSTTPAWICWVASTVVYLLIHFLNWNLINMKWLSHPS